MSEEKLPYEVEIRFRFESYEGACLKIPFLADSLSERKEAWQSRIYSREIFREGRLLRVGVLTSGPQPRYFLCLKGPDIGSFANIRQEFDDDVTGGTRNNRVMKQLGGKTELDTVDEIVAELIRLGHLPFMSFGGEDTYGLYEPGGVDIKIMRCPELKYPLMIEFEKIASSREEALRYEQDLKDITEELELGDCLVREEPPTLLYQALFE